MVNEGHVGRLREVVAFMREVGAVRVRVDGIEVELGPAPVAAPGAATPWSGTEEESSKCPCGCPLAEHSEAGCLNGCADERCAPADAEKA